MLIDEFYPSVQEVMNAENIFKAEMLKQAHDIATGETSIDLAIKIAAVKVWEQARRYQNEQHTHAAEKQNKGGIKSLLKLFSIGRKRGA